MDPLHKALDNLKTMFEGRTNALSSLTRASILISMNIEATHILAYLLGLQERWRKTLPFREHSDIDFNEWAETLTYWTYHINNVTFSGFRDRYPLFMPDENFGTAIVGNFAKWQDMEEGECLKRLYSIAKPDRDHIFEFKDQPEQLINFHLFCTLNEPQCAISGYEYEDIRKDLTHTLQKIVSVFNSLQTLQELEVMNDAYGERCARLFEHVVQCYCKVEKEQARMEFEEFMGTLDITNNIAELELATRMLISEIGKDPLHSSISAYIDLQRNIMQQTPGIGRYLFQKRKQLDDKSLHALIGKLLRLSHYQQQLYLLANKDLTAEGLSEEEKRLCEGRSLSPCFDESLRRNPKATAVFYKVMDHLLEKANDRAIRKEVRINWLHIKNALERLGLISINSDSSFANTMYELFPNGIKPSSYIKALQRAQSDRTYQEKENCHTHRNLVKEVTDMLQPVMAILRKNTLSSSTRANTAQ